MDEEINKNIKKLTSEQLYNKDVILSQEGKHIIIHAAAGTGKTTSSLSLPYFAPQFRFLLLTFNNELCGNTKKRIQKDWQLSNIDVYTFHGFMTHYFAPCRNDTDLYDILNVKDLEQQLKPKHTFKNWNTVILDEFQDANYAIYGISQLIQYWHRKIWQTSPPLKIVIMGDILQCLYEYSGADRRFISLAHLLYNDIGCRVYQHNEKPQLETSKFIKLQLTETFRCPKPIVDFINNVMLGYPKMISKKPGIKPQLHICNIFSIDDKHPIFKLLLDLIKKANGDYSKIAIISRVIRNNKFIAGLANLLSSLDIPIYVSSNELEGGRNESKLTQGKLVFTSIHKSKGREWEYVIMLGFDNFRDNSISTNENNNTSHGKIASTLKISCPDTDYVAVSRAEKELHLIQHYTNDVPSYINKELLPRYVNIIQHIKPPNKDKKYIPQEKPIIYRASEISRHLNISVIRMAINKLGITRLIPAGNNIDTVNEIITPSGTIEDVSAINGIVVPVWYECRICHRRPTILDAIIRMLGNAINKPFMKYYNPKWITISPKDFTIPQILKMANLYIGLRDGYLYICQQMQYSTWDWITYEQLNMAAERINSVIQYFIPVNNHKQLHFEKMVSNEKQHISGSIDLDTLLYSFEFKHKQMLGSEDILQTAISMLLGHSVSLSELVSTINTDIYLEHRLESLQHIREKHTILLSDNSHNPTICQVISNNGNKVKCIPISSKGRGSEIEVDINDISADLTWLKQKGVIHDKHGVLYNSRSGELILIKASLAELQEMMGIIIKARENSGNTDLPSDTEFLNNCGKIRNNIQSGKGIDLSIFYEVFNQ